MAIHQGCSQAFNVPVKYMDTTPDMHLNKIYRCTYQKCVPTLVNKQLLLTEWLFSLLIFKILIHSKHLKIFLLFEQHSEN